MNGSVVKRTQDSLGKVIRKPPLTEKLLNKPPFRYLHDIFTEVIRTTGFMKGLYVELEMKSDNVKDKDAKITFLQKAIDVVIMVSGEPLTVKPARIVAGHEPEKTNELLQALAKCCLNKLSSDDAVRKVLAGEKPDLKGKPPSTSKSQDKENRESKEEDRNKNREKEGRRDSEIKDRSSSRDRKDKEQPKEASKQTEKEKARHKDLERPEKARDRNKQERENEKSRDREKEKDKDRNREAEQGKVLDKERQKDREDGTERAKEKDKDKDRDKGKEKDRGREKNREKERERDRDRDREREKRTERDKGKERSRDKEREQEKPKEEDRVERKSKGTEERSPKKTSDSSRKESKAGVEKEVESPARIPRPSSAKGQRRRPKPGIEGLPRQQSRPAAAKRKIPENKADNSGGIIERKAEKVIAIDAEAGQATTEKPLVSENGDISDELPPHVTQRRIPRPSSARPAPPRVKRQETAEIIPPERVSSGKQVSNVIVEGKKNSDDERDDEDEQFVVEEAAPVLPDMPEMEIETTTELNGDEKHGGLVKKILETKKDYETSQLSSKSKEQDKPFLLETARKKEHDLVSKEVEKLRTSIQTLCRSALPLGKIMDYIQEDMDSMQNELHMWRQENKEHAAALLREQSITDSAVEPLKAELEELEQLIKDQQDKICAVKANILKNEEKIQKMISSINFSSRT